MSYRIETDEDVQDGVRRVACEQLEKAFDELADPALGAHERVHQVRKRAKKVRALVRLVRKSFDDYSQVNEAVRDAARRVSDLRDAKVFVDTFDALVADHDEVVRREKLAPIRDALVSHRDRLARAQLDDEDRLAKVRADLVAVREAAPSWSLDADGFDAVEGGLEKTYERARDAMEKAYEAPVAERAERFHEWRKRVKYHRYHVRLLQDLWTPPMKALREELHALSDHLGDAHDLAELGAAVRQRADGEALAEPRRVLNALIDRRRTELHDRAHPLGEKCFAEDPDDFVERVGALWRAAR
ncbi:MAG TPA: CHAD domain-containing protein [Sandaracinaceae bacterium LLY-WYZ-13_1]|nr:CHAD domain-containing protein [Sandaracinaceae bacterium LLY-WYZ-13_1]